VLDFVHREVDVECLPADIPEHIEVDVTGLMVGQAVRVRDVAVNVKWTPVSESDMMLVHVVMPKVEEVAPAADAAAAAAATPAEPEVIKKGKVEKPEEEE
jgi:large subunit ribosomal protein L25